MSPADMHFKECKKVIWKEKIMISNGNFDLHKAWRALEMLIMYVNINDILFTF